MITFKFDSSDKLKIRSQISDDTGIRLTFEELRIKTIRAAQNLQKLGYKPKQVIGFMAANSAVLAPLVFGSFCAGCPINPLATSVGKEDIIRMLKKVQPSLMICDIEKYNLIKECLVELGSEAKIFTFGGKKDDSEPVESLFEKTGNEASFM